MWTETLANLDEYSAWIAAVVAGLTAVAWLVRRTVRGLRSLLRRTQELARKIDALEAVAQRELNPSPGDGEDSVKELARQAASVAVAIEALERRVGRLEEWRRTLEEWQRTVAGWLEAAAAVDPAPPPTTDRTPASGPRDPQGSTAGGR